MIRFQKVKKENTITEKAVPAEKSSVLERYRAREAGASLESRDIPKLTPKNGMKRGRIIFIIPPLIQVQLVRAPWLAPLQPLGLLRPLGRPGPLGPLGQGYRVVLGLERRWLQSCFPAPVVPVRSFPR